MTDPNLRRSLLAGDPESIRQAGLSPEELIRIQDIDRERLELFAEMVMGRRLNDAIEGLPLTARLMGESLHPLALEFSRDSNGEFEKRHQVPLAFARFLQDQLRERPPTPACLIDVLLYELISLEILNEFDQATAAKIDGASQESLSDEDLLTTIPFQLPYIRAISFNCDIFPVIKALRMDQPPSDPPPEPTYVIVLMNSLGAIEKSKINFPTLAFFEACDGKKSLSQITASLLSKFHPGDSANSSFQKDCIALCRALAERHLIGLELKTGQPPAEARPATGFGQEESGPCA
jgi:hypothetical protein